MEFLRIFASLVLVFGLLGALLWGLKRLQLRVQPGQGGRRLEVVESLGLGARQKLALVRVGEHEVLLGISPGQIASLGQWPAFGAAPRGPALAAWADEVATRAPGAGDER